jgi:hypothetical protein
MERTPSKLQRLCYVNMDKARMLSVHYQGPRRNYDFSAYVAVHQQANQDSLHLNEPIPENKTVRDFLTGITDSQCTPIKLNGVANKVFLNNFLETDNYIA